MFCFQRPQMPIEAEIYFKLTRSDVTFDRGFQAYIKKNRNISHWSAVSELDSFCQKHVIYGIRSFIHLKTTWLQRYCNLQVESRSNLPIPHYQIRILDPSFHCQVPLWVQFPGNTHTDNTNVYPKCTKSLWIQASAKCINVNLYQNTDYEILEWYWCIKEKQFTLVSIPSKYPRVFLSAPSDEKYVPHWKSVTSKSPRQTRKIDEPL